MHLEEDPTEKYNDVVRSLIMIAKNIFTDNEILQLLEMNPLPPLMNCLPKTRKPGVPMRPTVSFKSVLTKKLAKKLVSTFNNLCKFITLFSNNNDMDLISRLEKLKGNSCNNNILASLDIDNMYSNIPLSEVIEIFKLHFNYKKANPVLAQEYIKLLTNYLNQNYLKLSNQFYIHKTGFIMGYPISPSLADIFMGHFEGRYIMSLYNPYVKEINFYGRYVGGIFVDFGGTFEKLQALYEYVHSCHRSRNFK